MGSKRRVYAEKIYLKVFCYVYGGFAGDETALDQRNWKDNTTILDGTGSGNVVTASDMHNSFSRLDGFTIHNGNTGIYCSYSSPALSNNTVIGNAGSGIYCYYSSPVISNNIITDNAASNDGGGIHCLASSSVIANNTIMGNSSSAGGGIWCYSSSTTIINNTIVNNSASGNGGGICCGGSGGYYSPIISNNIIAFNNSGIHSGTNEICNPVLRNNCIYNPDGYDYSGLSAGIDDISIDPKLVSVKYRLLHIQPDSPCRNTGYDDSIIPDSLDMDGEARVEGLHVDIGADESYGNTWNVTPNVIRVSPSGSDTNDGSSWELAKKTVQAAIDAASASLNNEIWVAKGTYVGNLTLKPCAYLYGGFAGNETELEQRNWKNNTTVLYGNGGTAVLITNISKTARIDGFTIKNGSISCSYSSITICNNTLRNSGIYCGNSSPNITNNIIIGAHIYCHSSSSPTLSNNTITGSGSTGIYCSNSSPIIQNNIIAFNAVGVNNSFGSNSILRNNCVYNPEGTNYNGITAGVGDISVDPKFASYEYKHLHLMPNSPCIDTGYDDIVMPGALDMDAEARIYGSHVDIGADEYNGTTWIYIPRTIRVSPLGSDYNDGSSWNKTYRTIQAALDESINEDQVWVATGIYDERITLKKGVALYGGFPAEGGVWESRDPARYETIIDANSAGTAVTVSSAATLNTKIDGFTIKNGNAANGAGINCNNSSATITNNRIIANTATSNGGGINCSFSTVEIRNNVVQSNTAASNGGGMYLYYCQGSVANNIVAENAVIGGPGGGIYCGSSSVAITNNTIAYNHSPIRGGGISSYYYLGSIVNNIVAYNSTGIYKTGGTPTFSNNNVYNPTGANYTGLSAGAGDISVDPLFVDGNNSNYHLSIGSPCINAGYDAAVGADWLDMDGQSRIMGTLVDIGADELSGSVLAVGTAKGLGNGLSVSGYGAIVSAVFGDSFYVESDNRSSGIRVEKAVHALAPDMVVDIDGVLATNENGERYIAAKAVVQCGSDSVKPLYMIGKNLGGGVSLGQLGVEAGVGLNNIGLLVKLTGYVRQISGDYFIMDDGSNAKDASGIDGVRVIYSNLDQLNNDKLVSVVGISSMIKENNKYYRCIRALNVVPIETPQ